MFKYQLDDQIELRMLGLEHAYALYTLVDENRQHLREWLPWIDQTQSVENTKEFIQLTLKQYVDNNGIQAGIWVKGQLAGVIGYHMFNWQHKYTSIGYWLGEGYQGKGIMTKACETFINYAFDTLDMNRIEIRCASGNYRSQAIPKRLGFKEEGRIRCGEWLYDHYVDHIIYGLIAVDRFE